MMNELHWGDFMDIESRTRKIILVNRVSFFITLHCSFSQLVFLLGLVIPVRASLV